MRPGATRIFRRADRIYGTGGRFGLNEVVRAAASQCKQKPGSVFTEPGLNLKRAGAINRSLGGDGDCVITALAGADANGVFD